MDHVMLKTLPFRMAKIESRVQDEQLRSWLAPKR
jgi:hypothetical protein